MKNLKSFYRNYTIFIIVFCLFSAQMMAQENTYNQKSDFWNHVRFGGGIGLSFGNEFFSGTLAPSAIYQFNDQFALGLALSGTYNSQKYYYKSTILGGSIIVLFNPINEIQISAEFEENNVNINWDNRLGFANENYWYPSLFLGAGYRTRYVTIGIRYDVLYDNKKSTYADPWMPFIRIYF
ncbi:alpha-ketoglutarate decarboxylase [Xanthomarina sp. F1114]|uniref:alpha-ketoglutarate decarboxylase n=1 Tax=Xanthomarina sp. F1114 TaxID=2996019 RepID=UPI00225DEEC3|nr:alpha-ketoglutarate decarboxylase [Xanthomarina sp. F1114]MCX7548438.1 alpha-ketoglutarate decarboxylase [Xanthomarina sp. F1114]